MLVVVDVVVDDSDGDGGGSLFDKDADDGVFLFSKLVI